MQSFWQENPAFAMGAGGQQNLAAISGELADYFSLEITPGLNRLFMCCH